MQRLIIILFAVTMSFSASQASFNKPASIAEVQDNSQMHKVWDDLLQDYVNDKGMVDYEDIGNDRRFSRYIQLLEKIAPDEDWPEAEKKAYWINAYNAFAIKLVTDNWPVNSIMDLDKPFDKKFIKIGRRQFSLNELENKMLREKHNDPRIHFGVNCASMSCPKLHNRAFTVDNVDSALEKLTKEFINNPEQNKITADAVTISKIFEWYKEDFTKNGSLIDYLNKYSDTKINANASVSYMEYDWSLNDQE